MLSYRPDQSLNADGSIAKFRYFEISLYQVRAGHGHEWDELVKLVMAAYTKVLAKGGQVAFQPGERPITGSKLFERIEQVGCKLRFNVDLPGTVTLVCYDVKGIELGRLSDIPGRFKRWAKRTVV